VARVDIRTGADRNPDVGQYTVLTELVLKGDLAVPAIVVVQLPDPAIVLDIGESYLFLTRFDPVALRYVIDDPSTGIVSSDVDIAVWREAVAVTGCSYDDVLMWDGTIYARQQWNDEKRFVPREYVGKSVGSVETLNWAATACSTWIADGMASRVPEGTAIHRMKAYDPRFRVVVRLEDGHRYLYQAVYRETATVGSDLLDLASKLESVMLVPPCDDVADCDDGGSTIRDSGDLDAFVAVLQGARVMPDKSWLIWVDREEHPSTYVIDMTFRDGSRSRISVDYQDGSTECGLQIPLALFDRF
jgi:hypothetical protein